MIEKFEIFVDENNIVKDKDTFLNCWKIAWER